MYDINKTGLDIIIDRRNTMGNIISILQEIFTGKETSCAAVGLSSFKTVQTPVERKPKAKAPAPKELKLSELMRHRQTY